MCTVCVHVWVCLQVWVFVCACAHAWGSVVSVPMCAHACERAWVCTGTYTIPAVRVSKSRPASPCPHRGSHPVTRVPAPRLRGGVRAQLLCGLLLVPGDPQHLRLHQRLRLRAVVDPAQPDLCLERPLRVHHPRHRDHRQGARGGGGARAPSGGCEGRGPAAWEGSLWPHALKPTLREPSTPSREAPEGHGYAELGWGAEARAHLPAWSLGARRGAAGKGGGQGS